MPCKVNVWVEGGRTIIAGMRPTVIAALFPQANLGNIPQEVDAIIRGIVDESK